MKTIKVIVNKQGESKVETDGFTGSSCQESTRDLVRKLGQPGESELKPEFYQQASADTDVEQST